VSTEANPEQQENVRLLAYQVNELRKDFDAFGDGIGKALTRIESKIDDNLQVVLKRHDDLDIRVQHIERWKAAVQQVDERVQTRRMSTWQIAGIAAGMVFGLGTLAVSIIAIVLTVVLHG
jgi:ElaB/YqjD/DUF883 family membrane-anchored ribosome-binding protein